MPETTNSVEHQTIINNVEYTLQSRTIAQDNGEHYEEYRVLLEGKEIKSWTRGNVIRYFSL
ncbi:MAG: hypothetical protein JO174_03170 [Herbaspirillum sp.]|nr:hypothetical protein [Herbaspirillum sp.]